jgi:uroporphyrinogen-III decarboxylase
MAVPSMTPRERVLAAMKRQPVDYVPCLPTLNPLLPEQRIGKRWQFPCGPSPEERCEFLVREFGTDALWHIGVPDGPPAPGVESRAWVEGELIHKLYRTPAGELRATVRHDEMWPHGLDIPLYSDFLIGHAVKPWVETERDVECLEHILRPWEGAFSEAQRFATNAALARARRLQLPVAASVGSGLTGAMQLFGSTGVCLAAAERPGVLERFLDHEHRLNLRRLELARDLGVDIVIRNGFYETADFYSPAMLERFLGNRLRAEARTARQAGLVTSYTLNTGLMPLLDYLAGLEFDNFNSIDIAFHGFDLAAMRDAQGTKRSYWIGPSSVYHISQGTPETVRAAVRQCFEVLGRRGLLIGPCPSMHCIMPWENFLAMVEEWKTWR